MRRFSNKIHEIPFSRWMFAVSRSKLSSRNVSRRWKYKTQRRNKNRRPKFPPVRETFIPEIRRTFARNGGFNRATESGRRVTLSGALSIFRKIRPPTEYFDCRPIIKIDRPIAGRGDRSIPRYQLSHWGIRAEGETIGIESHCSIMLASP